MRGVFRAVGWIERVALDAGDLDQVEIGLKACRHCPHDILQIKAVDVLIDQKYVLQFGKGGKCEQRRLPLASLVRRDAFFELNDGDVFSTARGSTVDIPNFSGVCLFEHDKDAGLGRNSGHGDMLLARPDTGLHDRIAPGRDRLYFDDRKLGVSRSAVARKFRHGFTGVGILVFAYPYIRQNFTLDDVLGVCDGAFVNRQALY